MALLLLLTRLSVALLWFTVSGADAAVFHFPLESSPVSNSRVPVWQSDFPAITSHENLTLYDYMDVHYYCYVQFGTPSQRIRVSLDTNLSQVWVLNHHLGAHLFYDHNKSTTYQPIGTPVDHDGYTGFVSQDQITIGGGALSLPHHRFVEGMTAKFGPMFKELRYDGTIGLGLAPSPITNAPSLVPGLIQQGLLDKPVVGLLHGKSVNGHVTIGGIDSSAYDGDLHYTPVKSPSSTSWNLPLDAVLLDGKSLAVDKIAVLASDSPLVFGPKAEIDKIAEAAGSENLLVNCTTPGPVISFVFSGKSFTLTKDQYVYNRGVCLFGFAPNQDPNDQTWFIGGPFLRQFYTVLDYGSKGTNDPRVGFARATTHQEEA
ncbi:hypothetical protein Poli38472_010862 [Pythium oligandrum]|uniref:Peptidase A1 domain-containing protein n=1 Tax=Pythium oligandrum TaxID=41045 RepID=A0A8K1FI80_PYTOL|nr:hypothetical protein Poli38472_010862 [Pythium oligandrum]|eukprot:TMW61799.1 hypothetical protein Poli38472_010862 [Pythium oligandrum]